MRYWQDWANADGHRPILKIEEWKGGKVIKTITYYDQQKEQFLDDPVID